MASPVAVEIEIEWERVLVVPDGARCFACSDLLGPRTLRPVCVARHGSTLIHNIMPLLVCEDCHAVAHA